MLFETILIGSAANIHAEKDDDLLIDAAKLYGVDVKTVRATVESEGKQKRDEKGSADTKTVTGKRSSRANR